VKKLTAVAVAILCLLVGASPALIAQWLEDGVAICTENAD
jgi:hypothetical protein